MLTDLIDNQTRKAIALSLKKKGSMSVDELSREVGVTPMGVRQHLLVLERNGIVEYTIRKHGVGRPGFLYRLTGRAEDLFPNIYADLCLDLLGEIEEKEGRKKVEELFKARKDKILSRKIKTFPVKAKLSDRLSHLADMLREDGEIVEIEEEGSRFKFKKFTCPMPKVAEKYGEVCRYDLELFKGLLGEGIDMQARQRIVEGAPFCEYLVSEINS